MEQNVLKTNSLSLRALIILVIFFAAAITTVAEPLQTSVAARIENGNVLYYATLHEAFEAAMGISIDAPDEITLFADVILDESIILDTAKHIRLITDGGTRTIKRGSDNLDYPVIYVSGDLASLTLGKPGMTGELVIDGGYLNTPSIIANSPLLAISGRDAKLIMYDGVYIQNNYNMGPGVGTGLYQNGAGVFLRTAESDPNRITEFIMKGGVIRGNICDIQGVLAHGGAVKITGFALFTMEGGIIMNNSAYLSGGGFNTGSRGSFVKTGGIIYGNEAPEGLRNFSIAGVGTPPIYGHAVFVENLDRSINYRNDTVGENDNLSFIGGDGVNGIFGEGERWNSSAEAEIENTNNSYIFVILIPALLLICITILIILLIKTKRKQNETLPLPVSSDILCHDKLSPDKSDIELTLNEKKILELLFTDRSIKMIADTLELTYEGVQFHCKKIYQKLNVKNRKELLVKYDKK